MNLSPVLIQILFCFVFYQIPHYVQSCAFHAISAVIKAYEGKKSGLPLANISIIVIISKISEVVLFSSRMLCNQITRFSLTKIPKSLYLTQLTDYHSSC